ERFLQMVAEELWIVRGKTIAAWGLSFKPDTDDLRESVAIAILQRLVAMGARIRAYDPKAMAKAKDFLPDATICSSAQDAATGPDCALVLTEWEEFRNLNWPQIKKRMAHPTILDGRNL